MQVLVRPITLTLWPLSSLPKRLISKASPGRMRSYSPGYCHLPPSQLDRSISSIPFAIYILTPLSFVSPVQIPFHLSFVILMVPILLPAPFLHRRRRRASLPPVFYLLHALLSLSYSRCSSRPAIFWVNCRWWADESGCGWFVGSVGHISCDGFCQRCCVALGMFFLDLYSRTWCWYKWHS